MYEYLLFTLTLFVGPLARFVPLVRHHLGLNLFRKIQNRHTAGRTADDGPIASVVSVLTAASPGEACR